MSMDDTPFSEIEVPDLDAEIDTLTLLVPAEVNAAEIESLVEAVNEICAENNLGITVTTKGDTP